MSLDLVDWVVVVSVIAMDLYGFYVLRKAHREIDHVGLTRQQMIKNIHKTEVRLVKEIVETKELLLSDAQELKQEVFATMDPKFLTGLGQAVIIKSLATFGAEDLKAMGHKDADIARIKMAMHGFRRIGNEVAKGAGVNQLIEQVQPMVDTAVKGQDMMDKFKDNPFVQLMFHLFGDKLKPEGGGSIELQKLPGGGGGYG